MGKNAVMLTYTHTGLRLVVVRSTGTATTTTVCKRQTLPMEGFRFFGRRHLYIHICDNGIVSFDMIRRPYWPIRLTSHQWMYSAVIAPFLANSRPLSPLDNALHLGTKLFYELYAKNDGNSYTAAILNRARDDGRSTRGFYLPYYDPVWAVVVTWSNVVPDPHICPGGFCPVDNSRLPRNSFQLVLSTDGTHSFAHFIYPTMKIGWASPDELLGQTSRPNAIAVAGYNAGQGYWLNNAMDMAYSGTMRMKRAWSTYRGHWSYPLQRQDDPFVPQPSVVQCAVWIRRQQDDRGLDWFLRNVYNWLRWAYTCPCTAEQAYHDNTYSYSISRSCAESRRRYVFTYGGRRYSISRTCCYSPAHYWWQTRVVWQGWWWSRHQVVFLRRRIGGGRLLRGSQGGHLIVNNRLSDQQVHRQCCVDSGRLRSGWYCRRFSQYRPWSVPSSGNPCRQYPLHIGWIRAWGDPHITTLDGVRYAFNGLGEFVVVDVDNGEHQVQGRTCFAKGSSHATVFCAIAASQKNHTSIQVNLEGESGVEVYANNPAVNTTLFEEEDFELEVDQTAVLTQPSNNSILIVFFSGITVKVTSNKAMLFMEFSAPEEYMNKTRGLLGRWDGDTSNDFEFFNGTLLSSKSSERQIFEMGSSWRVTDGDGPKKSIFQYKPGEDSSNFTSDGFLPKFTDELNFGDPELQEEAREVCGNDTSCLFDVGRLAEAEEQNFENSVSARVLIETRSTGDMCLWIST
ncbi:mucin-like protein [Branchiostoma floridae x Branchiostoma japonicum]